MGSGPREIQGARLGLCLRQTPAPPDPLQSPASGCAYTCGKEEAPGRLATYEDFQKRVTASGSSSIYSKAENVKLLLGIVNDDSPKAEPENKPAEDHKPAAEQPQQDEQLANTISAVLAVMKGKGKGKGWRGKGPQDAQAPAKGTKGSQKGNPKGDGKGAKGG